MFAWKIRGIDPSGKSFELGGDSLPAQPLSGTDFAVDCVTDGDNWERLTYKNLPAGYVVTDVVYPAISTPLTPQTAVLLPESQGMLITDLMTHPAFTFKPEDTDYIFETRFRAMKFAALLEPAGNTFLAINDDNCYAKAGDIYRSADRKTLFFDVITAVPQDGASNYIMPFGLKMVSFTGDWFAAAELYKQIFPVSAGRLPRKNDKIRDIGIWLWNRDQAANVIPPAEQLQIDSGVPVALDWYWYHAHPYDTHYPDFYPPREGVEKFTASLKYLNEKGIFTHVYVNGFLWDMENEDWNPGGCDGVIMDKDGKMISTAFNVFMNRQMAYMCGEASEHHQKLISQIKLLADCGLDGIYIDMIGCATMQFCYNPAHKHAPGGGCYMADGYRKMLRQLHDERPDLYLSTEDCNETYMNYVDSVICVMATSGERYSVIPPFSYVPFFSAVHHGDLIVYGSSAHIDGVPPYDSKWPQEGKWKKEEDWNHIAPEQFYVELGRSLIWGQQPMVANLRPEHLTNPALRERYEFICKTAKFYHRNRNWLLDGRMLHPGTLETTQITARFVVRYIFTKEGTYKVVERQMPAIMHSNWVDAAGKRVMAALNITDVEQSFRLTGKDYAEVSGTVPAHSYKLFDL